MNCIYCGKEIKKVSGWLRLNCHEECSQISKEGFPALGSGKVFIKDYGKVEKSRLDELSRRVIMPDHKEGGGYYVGRRGENGKVEDREPTY